MDNIELIKYINETKRYSALHDSILSADSIPQAVALLTTHKVFLFTVLTKKNIFHRF